MLCVSCGNQEKLEKQISDLENQNRILLDSLENLAVSQIYSSELIILPETTDLKLHEKNKLFGLLVEHQKFLKYNLYRVDTTYHTSGAKRELIASGLTDYQFEFEYVPEKKNDNWIHILAEFDLDSVKIQIPGIVVMDAK